MPVSLLVDIQLPAACPSATDIAIAGLDGCQSYTTILSQLGYSYGLAFQTHVLHSRQGYVASPCTCLETLSLEVLKVAGH